MMIFSILGFLLGLLFLVTLFTFFVLGPILGFIAYWRVRWVRSRLAELQAEVERHQTSSLVERTGETRMEAESDPRRGISENSGGDQGQDALLHDPEENPTTDSALASSLPEPDAWSAVGGDGATHTFTPAPRSSTREPPSKSGLEGLLGQKVLGWAAVGLMLLAVGYFLKYAFDNQWIGPFGQVSLGILGGAFLCVLGYRFHTRGYSLYGQMLSATGVAILYLSVFASFGYYRLLPLDRAGIYLALIVLLSAGLAVSYPARGVAALTLIGGCVSPLLLQSDTDPYVRFFLYLALFDLGLLLMSLLRGWVLLAPLGLVAVQNLFWGWAYTYYHPEKLGPALTFQVVIYLLHTVHDVVVPIWTRKPAHLFQVVDLLLNSFYLVLAGTLFLDEDWWRFLPILAVGLAILYALQSRLVQVREPIDARLQLTLVALVFGFLAIALALRLRSNWVAVGWAAEGLALWWYGLRVNSRAMRVLAGVFLILATWQVLFGENYFYAYYPSADYDPLTPMGRIFSPAWYVPILNRFALPGLLVAGSLLICAWWYRTMRSQLMGTKRGVWVLTVLTGILLGLYVLSVDVHRFVRVLEDALNWSPREAFSLAGMSVSVLWAVYAWLVLAIGFWRNSPTVRYVGLGLFALALLKALFLDSARLEGIYRVLAFFVLAVVMGFAAWTYQQLERAHNDRAQGEVS